MSTFLAAFGRLIVLALLVLAGVFAFVALAEADEPPTSRETMYFANGAYTAIVTAVGLKLQTLGVAADASYKMAGKCVGAPSSVYDEARGYLERAATLGDLGIAMTLVAYDRCGLLEEKKS